MMKKILVPFLILISGSLHAQLSNSWIDYSKTYYKFRIAKDTLCRITQPTLVSLGLQNVPAEQFQLWRNGKQVRLYTTLATGVLGAADYIEFIGQKNDGFPDNDLYRDPDYQLDTKNSLFTDTVSYFLTVNTATANNLRYTNGPVLSPGALVPDAYFFRREEVHYQNQINRGYAAVVGEYVYSSSFDMGEGWSSTDANPCCDLSKDLSGLNVYTAGPANGVTLKINASGNALNGRNLRVKFYNNIVLDSSMPYFNYGKFTRTGLPLTLLQSTTNLPVSINGTSTNSNDRVVVSNFSVTYPATFNFNNQKNWYFELKNNAAGNYLVIDNFNAGGTAPVLYDLNTNQRYIGDIASTPGKVKFVLPPSSDTLRKYQLFNYTASNINVIPASGISSKTFTNFALAANQGDYLIITHPSLNNNGNYVDKYRDYRASATGGGYNAKVVSITELTDQFGYGIKDHPTSIRDFLRYANQAFTVKPKYVFLIGRGVSYFEFQPHLSDPVADQLNLVPSFGWPASDVLLACEPGTNVPLVPIGRLAAVNGNEVNVYLNKIKEYEQAQQSPSQTLTDKAWMKNMMHVIGGSDSAESAQFNLYMQDYKGIAEDTLWGAHVETFTKSSTASVQQVQSQRIEELFQEGLSFIGYFGHSSASTLEFNLSSPETYNNQGKYPFFNVSGCAAGNFFLWDPLRLNGNLTLSEKYVLAPNRGSIAFMATTHLGIPPFLNFYNFDFYNNFCNQMYGNTVGNQIRKVIQDLGSNPSSLDYYTRLHLEELNLHGDPAIKLNVFQQPDYAIEDKLVKITPTIISVADNNFTVDIKMMNLGKAVNDSIRVTVKRKLPAGNIVDLYNQKIRGIRYMDSLQLVVPINPITDKGQNQLIIQLDADNKVAESSETNNTLTKDFFIFEDELRPVYPYTYSIMNQQNITYTASTANPLGVTRQYVMELDTTELFNSPFKKSYNASGPGGIVQFVPSNVTYTDSSVYYWRTAMVPLNNGNYIWNNSSFVYLPNSTSGFNQSHYFQHLKSSYDKITLDVDRKFKFNTFPRSLIVRNGLYPTYSFNDNNINLDLSQIEFWGCKFHVVQVYVLDPATLTAWSNFPVNGGTEGRYKSWVPCANLGNPVRKFFEFPHDDPTYRKRLIDFLTDSIPNGNYVVLRNLDAASIFTNTTFIDQWKADTATLGSGKSLYHTFKNIGFDKIDSFYHNVPFIYVYQKGTPAFTPKQYAGTDYLSYLDVAIPLTSKYVDGSITSPVFGPAKKWNAFHWRGTGLDVGVQTDSVQMEIYGVKTNGTSTLLRTVAPAQDTTLAFVDPAQYPYVQLKMLNKDTLYATPSQLRYWRINADFVPEGAIAPNISYKMKDTVEQGESIDFAVAFKNISQVSFDSLMKAKFIITDRNNIPHVINIPKRKILVVGDTLMVTYTIDTRNYPGNNTLFLDVNPDNDQPEQYHFNNLLYKNFYVKEDKYNPLLDVTFDGVHILNRDIVASKPHILVKLKDESRFLALADTSLMKVQVMFPDGSLRNYKFGPDTLRFTPANLGAGNNTASIDFLPYFPDDGEYQLIVSGKDVVGNNAGDLDYRVTFNVINKPMISNLLNYPNPFTTSTAFVFTVTGAVVPQNIRIQILTITGKVVREITKDELGPIHIGRNITEFKWDGTDMYGQKLANGVYLYRVSTNLNGQSLDKYKADGDKTDKYFTKGYGKMYLMR